jgi:hypothetical protein
MAVSTQQAFVGRGTVIGIGLETTWATAVSPTVYLRAVSGLVTEEYELFARPHLHSNDGGVAHSHSAGRHNLSGTIEVELTYAGLGLLLRAAMGPVPSTSGGGPYTHPFILGPVKPSLTIAVYRGAPTGSLTGRVDTVAGCMVNVLRISATPGEPIRATIEFIGYEVVRTDQATPTILDPAPVLPHHAGTIGWNSGTYDCNSFELSITNGFERRQNIGSLKTAKPIMSALSEIVVTLTRDHVDSDFIVALTAETRSDLTMTFTGASPFSFALTAHLAQVRSPTAIAIGSGGFGALPETIELVPHHDPSGSNLGLAITIINSTSSYAA